MEVRPLTADDLEAYLDHHRIHRTESGSEGDPIFTPFVESGVLHGARDSRERGWTRSLDEPGWIRSWGAFSQAKIIGDVELHGGEIEANRHRASIGVGVQRPYRGRGLGRTLMETAISWARSEGVAAIDLGVFEGNPGALRLYDSLGFKPVGTLEDAFRVRGQSINDIRMVLDLRR
ncbi:MAG: N-acetyltransferase [Acidimicrobiia bacterium]|nr:N-acetyltransferase [Acidimicrobiia bacterium]